MTYFVGGGVYYDFTFQVLKQSEPAVVRGPFDTYQEAFDEWKALSWLNVDNAQYRLTIVEDIGNGKFIAAKPR